MPWNQNNGGSEGGGGGPWGGGGNGGGGGGGPWGGGGGGGRGPQPPNLDDLLRQSQERLKDVMPPGLGGNKVFLGAILAIALVGYILKCVYTVEADQVAVELRLGKVSAVQNPGINFIFWPIETVEFETVLEEKKENIGFRINTSRDGPSDKVQAGERERLMLAGDQNIVDIQFTVLFKINDVEKYLFNVSQPRAVLRVISESAMREYVGRSKAETIRTEGRIAAQEAVQELIQTAMDDYDAGIIVTGVKLEDADPPPAVADAFEEVQRAQQDQDRFIQEAYKYRNKRLGAARGEAAQITERAIAYKERVVAEAQGEAARFVSVYDEYAVAKDVTRKRLFLETMEGVLGDSNKVIIEQGGGGQGVVPYLPLPELDKQRKK